MTAGSPAKYILEGPNAVEVLARRAGLDKALAEFPDDVEAAARMACAVLEQLDLLDAGASEPWPPMRVGVGS